MDIRKIIIENDFQNFLNAIPTSGNTVLYVEHSFDYIPISNEVAIYDPILFLEYPEFNVMLEP